MVDPNIHITLSASDATAIVSILKGHTRSNGVTQAEKDAGLNFSNQIRQEIIRITDEISAEFSE